MYLVVDKHTPDLSVQRTVGGLPKKQSDYCWNVIAAFGDLEKLRVKIQKDPSSRFKTFQLSNDEKFIYPSKIISSTTNVGKHVSMFNDRMQTSTTTTPRTNTSIIHPYKASDELSHDEAHVHTQATIVAEQELKKFEIQQSRRRSGMFDPIRPWNLATEAAAMPSNGPAVAATPALISHYIDVVKSGDESVAADLNSYRRTIEKAERKLRQMVRETPPDIQISNLFEIDLSNRANACETDLVALAQKAERENMADHAISYLTRAGINSKEPHVYKVFLGSFYFRTGKYLKSIQCYTDAMRMVTAVKLSAVYNQADDFIIRYNRAIAYFRTGNDAAGLKDLERALEIEDENVKALEVYAIVLRRLGRYDDAMKIKMRIIDIQKYAPCCE